MGKRPLRGVDGEVRISGLADRDGETKMCCHWITARILTIVTTEGRQSIFNMKSYKVKQLTRQYNGFNHYKWLIECGVRDEMQNRHDLTDWRDWCWQTWGPSRELVWATSRLPVPVWAWDTEFRHKRLYLKSDQELALFQLKF